MGWGLFLGIVANALGGASYFVQKAALAYWPPAVLIWLRMATCLPVLWATTRRGSLAPATRGDWARMVIIALFGLAAPHLVGIYGLRETDSLNGAVLILMEPVSIVLFSWLVLREHLLQRQMVGIGLAILGAVLVVSRGDPAAVLGGDQEVRGNLLLAIHGMLWAIYTIASKPTLSRVTPTALTAVTSTIAAIALFPAALVEWPGVDMERVWAPIPLSCVLALGLGVSWAVTVMWNMSLARIRPVQMAALIFLQPLAGAVIGVCFGENLSVATIAGAALVIGGVWFTREVELAAAAAQSG